MAAVAAMALSVAGASYAQMDDDPFTFSVTNDTSATMTSMRLAAEGSQTGGREFLTRQLATGQTAALRFRPDEGRCRFLVIMNFSDGDTYRNTVDFCEIHGIRARNDGMHTY